MEMIISRINRVLSQDKWTESDIYNVMTNLRQLLESENLKDKYQILNLYCNWTLHVSLKQSVAAYRMLERISDALINYGVGLYEEGHFSDAVIEGIALHKLLEEIVDIGVKYEIPSAEKFKDVDKAYLFIGELLIVLLGKPLIIDDDSLRSNRKLNKIAYNIYKKSINQTGDPERYIVIGFSFVFFENKIFWRLMTKYSMKNKINMVGKLILVDQKEIDRVKLMRENNKS